MVTEGQLVPREHDVRVESTDTADSVIKDRSWGPLHFTLQTSVHRLLQVEQRNLYVPAYHLRRRGKPSALSVIVGDTVTQQTVSMDRHF